tara:strand:+ start:500 stop:682 length:183 start_codon:yes stop_codon:yes gene_type:complete
MSDPEWFHISQRRKKDEKDEQIRDVRGDGVYIDDDPFTSPDVVPILIVNDEEDDFGEEEE